MNVVLRRWLKRYWLEMRLHIDRIRSRSGGKRVVIFPSGQPWDAASNLRAWLIAPQLQARGWRAIVVPEPLSLAQRHRILRSERPDVILLQQTRHPLNRPSLYPSYPCVVDADDADFLDARETSAIAQAARDAAAVVGGSRFVAGWLAQFNCNSYVLWTCTPRVDPPRTSPQARARIVAWAHASPFSYPEEASFVQSVMIEVNRLTECEFWLFGVTEEDSAGWFQPIRDAGGTCVAIAALPYGEYLRKVAEAAVGLQPIADASPFSRGKSFGKVLAYLSGQVAVVASNAVDHPVFFTHWRNGVILENSVNEWAGAIALLLNDLRTREKVALAGYDAFNERLTSEVFARLLDPVLTRAGAPTED